jgi:GGDEF domain-containing protein
MDALEAGGDDFPTKPIRPRRVPPCRTASSATGTAKRDRRRAGTESRNGGLLHRADMWTCSAGYRQPRHALLFVELNSFNMLKDRLGLTVLEDLLKRFSALRWRSARRIRRAFRRRLIRDRVSGRLFRCALHAYASKIRGRLMAPVRRARQDHRGARAGRRRNFGMGRTQNQLINTAERSARARSAPRSVMFKPQSSAEALREEHIINLSRGQQAGACHQPIVAVAGGFEKQFRPAASPR